MTMTGELKRPPSLYIHDPYGRGQMVRLGTPVATTPAANLTFELNEQPLQHQYGHLLTRPAVMTAPPPPSFPSIRVEEAAFELEHAVEQHQQHRAAQMMAAAAAAHGYGFASPLGVPSSASGLSTSSLTSPPQFYPAQQGGGPSPYQLLALSSSLRSLHSPTTSAHSPCSHSPGHTSQSHSPVHSHHSHSSSHGSNPRSPKPRKNHSAGLAEPVPVCLDYLKGVCNRKRWRCKFAHPPLALDVAAASGSSPAIEGAQAVMEQPEGRPGRVCEVWAVTGFCKFGLRCRDEHPPGVTEPITKVCLPAETKRMTNGSREAARRMSELSNSSSDSLRESPVPMLDDDSSSAGAASSWLEARRALESMRWETQDNTLLVLLGLLNDARDGLGEEQLLPLMFGLAIADPASRGPLFASTCERLLKVLATDRQHEFRLTLVRLAESVLKCDISKTDGQPLTPAQVAGVNNRKRGTALFLGDLFRLRLVPAVKLQRALDYCARRAADTAEEGALYADLGCLLLNAVGQSSDAFDQRTLKRLATAVKNHAERRAGTPSEGSITPPPPCLAQFDRRSQASTPSPTRHLQSAFPGASSGSMPSMHH